MNPKIGLRIERDIANALNNKMVKDVPNNLKFMIKQLFHPVSDESIINAIDYENVFKADIKISIMDKILNLSIKSGKATTLHKEMIGSFTAFLFENGVSEKTIETIKLFHFGDDTIDGTGERRMNYNEIMVKYKDRIAEANYELNGDRQLVQKVVSRCMFEGSHPDYVHADVIYFGDVEYGVFATKQQVLKHIRRKYYSYYETLHIGPLILRPDSRYLDGPVRDERKRNSITAYWPALEKDIEYIANRYNFD